MTLTREGTTDTPRCHSSFFMISLVVILKGTVTLVWATGLMDFSKGAEEEGAGTAVRAGWVGFS